MSRDPLDQAREFHDEPESYWKPRPGDFIGGKIVAIEVRSTEYDPRVPVVILEQNDGSLIAVWALHTVLREELVKLRPKIGETIAIRRLDDAEVGYRRYRVFSDREETGFDWGDVQTDAGDVDPRAPREPVDDLPF